MNRTERIYKIQQLLKARRAVPRAVFLEELEVSLPLPIETVGFTDYGKRAPYFIDYLGAQNSCLNKALW